MTSAFDKFMYQFKLTGSDKLQALDALAKFRARSIAEDPAFS